MSSRIKLPYVIFLHLQERKKRYLYQNVIKSHNRVTFRIESCGQTKKRGYVVTIDSIKTNSAKHTIHQSVAPEIIFRAEKLAKLIYQLIQCTRMTPECLQCYQEVVDQLFIRWDALKLAVEHMGGKHGHQVSRKWIVLIP